MHPPSPSFAYSSRQMAGMNKKNLALTNHQHNNIIVLTIPQFENSSGYLPPGVHKATWEEFVDRFGFNSFRQKQIGGLLKALLNLKLAGCQVVLIDGSFVTNKSFPADYDGAWDPTNVDFGLVDPILLKFDDKRSAMKAKYLGELFVVTATAALGVQFGEFFQKDRDGNPKGVIRIDLGSLP
jgi:hypothetical protein